MMINQSSVAAQVMNGANSYVMSIGLRRKSSMMALTVPAAAGLSAVSPEITIDCNR